MKLQQIADYKNVANDLVNSISLKNEIVSKESQLSQLLKFDVPEAAAHLNSSLTLMSDLAVKNNQLVDALEQLVNHLDKLAIDHGLMLNNNADYKNKFTETNLANVMQLTSSGLVENILASKIYNYANWQYPALMYNCRYNKIYPDEDSAFPALTSRLDYMIAGDPLYILTFNLDETRDEISKFPSLYQRRLRLYEDSGRLPFNQFGFIFCWDFFNYLTVDRIEEHLKLIIKLLRPGGTILFSYSNSDMNYTARLIDEYKCSWANKTYIKNLLLSLGYEITVFHDELTQNDVRSCVSWVEARKPGNLATVKRHQVLGEILHK